ncbi:MAG TPA: ABC transporter substrate-binding protein, partial [Calditrichia bacterium]|nr:ABC transporter substrate-binding protein [Calditrichia bacterium]
GAEIYTNLERGVIDATEWIGPYHDYIMGFPRVAKYYYYPGWHEPGSVLELMINKQAYESLPGDLQAIVRSAALRANHWMLCEFEAKNLIYLEKIREEFKTEILAFPEEVLAALKVYAKQAIEELISDDPMSKKIYENYRAFHQRVSRWGEITEKVYYQER